MDDNKAKILTDVLADFIAHMAVYLPDDVKGAINELKEQETEQTAAAIYECMIDNIQKATASSRPVCQDTGVLQFHIKAGAHFTLLAQMRDIITNATRIATVKAPLRHNTVETFTDVNTGDNTGTGVPCITWDIVSDNDEAEIDIYMAGGGCSLPGRAMVLMPAAGFDGIRKYVYDTVLDRGINACPPLIVGVGIGTTADNAATLSKKALLRPLDTPNSDAAAAEFERELKDGLNSIGIGPQGLTGKASVLGVNVEWTAHHPATLAVGVSTGCWATRRGKIHINGDMTYKVMSHENYTLKRAGDLI